MRASRLANKSIKIFILLTTFWVLSGTLVNAQLRFNFEEINNKNGLSDNQINQTLQDYQGFIWMATSNGLNRFDGYGFLKINTQTQPGISHNDVIAILLVDSSLWVAHRLGINILDLKTYQVKTLNIEFEEQDFVSGLFLDSHQSIWIYTHNGNLLRFFDQKIENIQKAGKALEWLKSPYNSISAIGENENAVWWSRLDGNIYTMQKKASKTIKLIYQGDSLKSKGKSFLDLNKNIWHSSNDWFLVYDSLQRVLLKQKIGESSFELKGRCGNYLVDKQNRIWIADFYGNLISATISTGQEIEIQAIPSKSPNINNIFIDANELIWLSTNRGVAKSLIRKVVVENYLTASDSSKGISIRGIMEDEQGSVFVGTYSGFFEINKKENNVSIKKRTVTPEKDLWVFYDLWDDEEQIWAVTEGNGIVSINKTSGKIIIHNFENPNFFSQRYFTTFYREKNGDFWIGGYEGFLYFESKNNLVKEFEHPAGTFPFRGVRVNDIAEDADSNLWIGTQNGLFRLNKKNSNIKKIDQLATNFPVQVLHFDKDKTLWVGTKGNGLLKYNLQNETITAIGTFQGLAENTVNGILESNGDKFLWISTNNGLSRLDKMQFSIKNFYKEDGFTSNEFNQKAFMKSADGKLWFGGINGLNSFYPDDLESTTINADMVLSGFSKFDGMVDSLVTTYHGHNPKSVFELAHNDRFITFEFALMDFERPNKNQFAYKIEGLHQDWVFIGNQRQIVFNNLGAGSYLIRIKGAGSNGHWSDKELAIQIKIAQVFYKTWWFALLCISVMASIAWIWHNYRINQLLKLERLRTQIARDLHDELGSSLTSIGIYSELAKEQSKETEKEKSLDEIASLSREASTTLRDIVWAIDTQDDHLSSLISRIRDHMHQMLEISGIYCEVSEYNLDTNIILPSFIKQNIYLILKEAINNIAKHSTANEVKLKLEKDIETLRIELSDNGTNKNDPDVISGGNGLRNMYKRAEAMGANLSVLNQNGFSIYINLPLKAINIKK